MKSFKWWLVLACFTILVAMVGIAMGDEEDDGYVAEGPSAGVINDYDGDGQPDDLHEDDDHGPSSPTPDDYRQDEESVSTTSSFAALNYSSAAHPTADSISTKTTTTAETVTPGAIDNINELTATSSKRKLVPSKFSSY